MKNRVVFSTSQTLFTFFCLIFFFTLLNGYVQNLVADYRANEWLVLAGLLGPTLAVRARDRGPVAAFITSLAYFLWHLLPLLNGRNRE